ncbi:TPA: hypothetical protein RXG71_005069 [Escherichia coli]|nr:hypothetical protein [Escherichia coli]
MLIPEFLVGNVFLRSRTNYARPDNRRMGYWQWVEQQALNNDAAVISCLRGRFYMQKKM